MYIFFSLIKHMYGLGVLLGDMIKVIIPKNVLPKVFKNFTTPLFLKTIIFVKLVDIFEKLRNYLSGIITYKRHYSHLRSYNY